jgi:hypothetical protein
VTASCDDGNHQMTAMDGYAGGMRHLQSLAPVALVTTGRTGSDFLQSLLESHPEVVTFNGSLQFYADFLPTSVGGRGGSFAVDDLMEEFVGRHIHRFKSRYDFAERKDQLGADRTQTLDLDTLCFRRHAAGLLEGQQPSARNLLLAIYGAYHLCLDRDLLAARILFHHAHRFDELDLFLRDFPATSVIVTTRDPRANLVSGIENGRELFPRRDNEKHLYHYLNHVLDDTTPCEARRVRYTAVRLEDLPKESTLRACADWVGIAFRPTMLESTWGGLRWYGDRLSPKPIESTEWTPTRTDNNWRNRLSRVDLYVLNALMFSRLRHYDYPCTEPRWWDALLVPMLLCLPLRYERRFFTVGYITRNPQARPLRAWLDVGGTLVYYLLRVKATLRHYFRARRRPFRGPWLGGPEPEAR